MREDIQAIYQSCSSEIEGVTTVAILESLTQELFGKKGKITELLKGMKDLTPEERPAVGKDINDCKEKLLSLITEKALALGSATGGEKETKQQLDPSLPAVAPVFGSLHPNTLITREVKRIFASMGFLLVEGPEIELDWYNFEVLNMPKTHPARDTQDTFYLSGNQLLRTQTSAVQARVMEKQQPPVRIFSIGKVFRRDYDITHTPMFHQVEGLVVDKKISITDLKGVLTVMMQAIFGTETKIRLRPHNFPYTEPSVEQDISCPFCIGKGCRVCKQTGWIELGGAGMVHPQVLRNVGYDPEEVSGFAFGFGIDRVAMIKYNIPDLRLFFENDARFLHQFCI